MKEKTCAVFYSGGKDGHLALVKAVKSGYKISCIINIDGGKKHRAFFNDKRKTPLIRQQAKIMGFPLFVYKPSGSFKPKKFVESFFEVIVAALKEYKFNSVFIGSTEDEAEHKSLLELSGKIKIKIILPIVKQNIFRIIKECEKLKIKPLIKSVDKNVSPAWIGKIFDSDVLKYIRRERKNGNFIDGNYFQTLVVSSPLFKDDKKGNLMKNKKCAVMYSGGKDSHLALSSALEKGYEISCLINIDGGKNHSRFFNELKTLDIIKEQAKIMGFPLFVFKADDKFKPKNCVQNYSQIIKKAKEKYDFDYVFTGSTQSSEHKAYMESSKKTGIKPIMPFGKKDFRAIALECRRRNIKALIVSVHKELSKKWFNKIMDMDIVEYIEQKHEKNPFLNSSEVQTFVVSGPLLKKNLKILKSKIIVGKGENNFLKIQEYVFK